MTSGFGAVTFACLEVGYTSLGHKCKPSTGRLHNKLNAGVNSKQFLNKLTLAKTYNPKRALDMATTNLLTSLKWPILCVRTSDNKI